MNSARSSGNNSRRNSDESLAIIKRSVSPNTEKNKPQNSIILIDSKSFGSKKDRFLYNIAMICREIFIIAVTLFSVIIMTLFIHKLFRSIIKEYKNKNEKLSEIDKNLKQWKCNNIMQLFDGRCKNLNTDEIDKLSCSSTRFQNIQCKNITSEENERFSNSSSIEFIINGCGFKNKTLFEPYHNYSSVQLIRDKCNTDDPNQTCEINNCLITSSIVLNYCKNLSSTELKELNWIENRDIYFAPYTIKGCRDNLNKKNETENISIDILKITVGIVGSIVNDTVETIGIYALFMMVIIFVLSTFLRISY